MVDISGVVATVLREADGMTPTERVFPHCYGSTGQAAEP
jgi:hypothetical protein